MVEKLKQLKLFAVAGRAKQAAMPIIVQVVYFAIGLVLSQTVITGAISPLGFAFVLGVPGGFCLAAAAGAVVGYAAGLELLLAAKYLAAVCVAAVLRWVFQNIKYGRAFSSIGGLATLFAIQIIYLNYLPTTTNIAKCFAEMALCVGISVLFYYLPYQNKRFANMDIKQLVAVLVLGTSVLCAALSVTVSVINIGFLVGGTMVLCCGYCMAERGAAISSVVMIMAVMVSGGENLFIAVAIVLAGLAAAYFCKGERIAYIGYYCVAMFFGLAISPTLSAAAACFATAVFSSVLFLLIPLKLLHFTPTRDFVQDKKQSIYLSRRLNNLACALQDVGTAVEGVCDVLWKKKQDITAPIEYACDTICKNCTNSNICWIDNYNDTMDIMNASLNCLRSDGYVTVDNLPSHTKSKCVKAAEICGALNRGFAMYLANKTSKTQAQMLKTALAEQYGAMASTLVCVAGEIWHEERLDTAKTSVVKQLFCEIELEPLEAAVYTDKSNCLRVQVKTERVQISDAQLQVICTEVSHCCKHKFTPCEPCHTAGVTTFVFLEKPLFAPSFAQCMYAAKGDTSADVIDFFCDDRSNAHMVLCDGMGTGKVASIDGKMAAALSHRLLQAGFSSEGVARLVNVALCLKSDDETGATLDAFSVNLFTGKAVLYKAGAAQSFFIKNKKVEIFSADSLPMGSDSTVTGSLSEFVMNPGDMVVLVSDGILAMGDIWVKKQLLYMVEDTPQRLADKLCEQVRKNGENNDDISVAVLKLD